MNLCLPYTPCLVHPLWIVTWKVGCPCVSLHVCPSHLIFVATPCLECVHASVHEFMSTWHLMSGPPPMHSLMETWVPLYGSVFESQSSHFICLTLFRMCTCISTWIYVYLTPNVWSTPYGWLHGSWVPLCVTACVSQSPYFCSCTLFRLCTCISTWIYVHLAAYFWSNPLGIVWWKPGCSCLALCLCPSHLISVATHCLECVHASVHEFMSTLHSMSGPPPMDSYMESWVTLCVTACVSQSPYFCSYTLFRLCTSVGRWIYVHLVAYVWSTHYA